MARYGLRVSMRDVAAEAGLSRGSVYRYFRDRDALVDAVLERTADRFVAAAARPSTPAAPSPTRSPRPPSSSAATSATRA